MTRILLICILVLGFVLSWCMVCADFYIIPTVKKNYAPVAKTGQETSDGKGDDGDLKKGVAWPSPRFTDNGDGTVTDDLTGLVWLKNANCSGQRTFAGALSLCNSISSPDCGLNDGSEVGDWRLANVRELQSLVHYGVYDPAVPNTSGPGKWSEGNPFSSVQASWYWSSTIYLDIYGWGVDFYNGAAFADSQSRDGYVWCVRDGP